MNRLLNPRILIEFQELLLQDKKFVILRIQSASDRPVKFKGTAFIRLGSHKKKLDDYPEKEKLIWKKEATVTFENGLSVLNLTGDEALQFIDYPGYFELMEQILPANKSSILKKLEEEDIVQSTKAGKYHITNVGAVLFAKDINWYDNLNRKAARVIIYKGKNKLNTEKEQVGKKGYATGFKGLIDYINDKLPTNEVIEKAFRKEVKMYPEIAVRELVANALIHQDFSVRGTGPMIEIYDDRIEISNPGKPLIAADRFVDHNPQSRNEKLAQFMRRMNICEERGSGIDKVIFACETYQLPAPKIIAEEDFTRVILYAYKSLRQMDKSDKIWACYCHSCLKYVMGEQMTNQSLRKRFGVEEKNYATVSRIISDTIEAGWIKPHDPDNLSRKHAKYVPYWD